ncbi:hypothetical protein [Arenimonas sp.]|uniref:hypothetical protein n=1 Tax=Arenimonas sp. TaxID=1872635 RepID=UPI0035B3D8C7
MLRRILIALMVVSSPGAGATMMRVNEFDAARFDYCESRQVNLDLLARVEAQVERNRPGIREMDRGTVALIREANALAEGLPDQVACREVFKSGRDLFRETLGAMSVSVRRSYPFERTDDEAIRGARLDLLDQWIRDEAARRTLGALPDDPQDLSVRWARAQANARIKIEAVDSTTVVDLVYEDFGLPEPAALGTRSAWQANQLAERYGVPVSYFGSDSRRRPELR